MRRTCLINNYNYGCFVAEAIDSALAQSVPFDEIVVVDDGSSDGSQAVLAAAERRSPRVKVVPKANGGQLSAFSAGFAESTGDIVYFLDADDVYSSDYVERTARVFNERADVGYVYCGRRLFGRVERVERPYEQELDLGYSAAVLAAGGVWFGASTSCVAMRRSVLERLLPAPEIEPLCRINADLCLAYGASLVGTKKYCVPDPLVGYRVHDRNLYYGKPENAEGKYRRRLTSHALSEYYLRRFGLDRTQMFELLHLEFATIPRPTRKQYKLYMRTALASRARVWRRLGQAHQIWRHYKRTRKAPVAAAASSAGEKGSQLGVYVPAKAS